MPFSTLSEVPETASASPRGNIKQPPQKARWSRLRDDARRHWPCAIKKSLHNSAGSPFLWWQGALALAVLPAASPSEVQEEDTPSTSALTFYIFAIFQGSGQHQGLLKATGLGKQSAKRKAKSLETRFLVTFSLYQHVSSVTVHGLTQDGHCASPF